MFGTQQRLPRSIHQDRIKTALLKRAVRHLRHLPHHLFERLEPRQLLAGADPIINEFLASNKTGITDNFNQTSDWIELYNGTGASVNLLGWHLSNDIAHPADWTFPNITINNGQYLIVWATGRNLTDPTQPLHTDFKLDPSPGEYLALTRPDNSIVTEFAPTYPEQLE
ncbi:MAG TPA: lamin tail domain-containing protein, partial [Tepidisphaeraceae bacterium]|nr:lamin tail domain-containing protein [Tepidisphaeraceae bacterium]